MRNSATAWKAEDLVGGDPSIDFVNTVSDWSGECVDRLADASALVQWAKVAGLISSAELAAAKAEIAGDPKSAARVYDDACALRAALHAAFLAIATGARPAREALGVVGEFASRAMARSTLRAAKSGVERVWRDDVGALERIAFDLARRAEHILTETAPERLRLCDGDGCGWLFFDVSKNGRRRWCSMTSCGAAEKVRRFRRSKVRAA
jgi:predicted RNA-binding Zn ribbon-like protein